MFFPNSCEPKQMNEEIYPFDYDGFLDLEFTEEDIERLKIPFPEDNKEEASLDYKQAYDTLLKDYKELHDRVIKLEDYSRKVETQLRRTNHFIYGIVNTGYRTYTPIEQSIIGEGIQNNKQTFINCETCGRWNYKANNPKDDMDDRCVTCYVSHYRKCEGCKLVFTTRVPLVGSQDYFCNSCN